MTLTVDSDAASPSSEKGKMTMLRALALVALLATAFAAQAASAKPTQEVKPRIKYETRGVETDVVLPVEKGRYKVRLRVEWGRRTRTTTFSFSTAKDFIRQCPNSTCVPNVWAFDYFAWPTQTTPEPEFSFLAGDVTASVRMWRIGGPLVFSGTYQSHWKGLPTRVKVISMNTPSGINTCIDGGYPIRAGYNGLYCLRFKQGTLLVRRLASSMPDAPPARR